MNAGSQSSELRGGGALLLAALLYGSYGFLIRESSKMFGTGTQGVLRLLLAALLVAGIAAARHKQLKLKSGELGPLLCMGLFGGGIMIGFTVAIQHISLAAATLLLYAGSITTSVVVGTFVLHESMTIAKVGAIGLALLGLFTYCGWSLHLGNYAAWALVGGILDGATNSWRKKVGHIARHRVIAYQNLFAVAPLIVFALVSHEQCIRTPQWGAVLAIVLFGFGLVGIGYLLLYGFRHVDLNVGTVILATELFFAALIGWLIYGEVPSPHELLGGLLIFVASILTVARPADWLEFVRRRRRKGALA